MASNSATITIVLLTLAILNPLSKAEYVLSTNERLNTGASLQIAIYRLTMQDDCNLVLYERLHAVWATKTDGRAKGSYSTMQSGGNLVVYSSSGGAVWASNTARDEGNYVILQSNRNLVIYGSSIWASGSNASLAVSVTSGNDDSTTNVHAADTHKTPIRWNPYHVLEPNERLLKYGYLRNGGYVLSMQEDCNLVLYKYGKQVWATNTSGLSNNCYVTMKLDGNLVVYSSSGVALWASNTARDEGYYVLILQSDGNLVIHGSAIWATDTSAVNVDPLAVNVTSGNANSATNVYAADTHRTSTKVDSNITSNELLSSA